VAAGGQGDHAAGIAARGHQARVGGEGQPGGARSRHPPGEEGRASRAKWGKAVSRDGRAVRLRGLPAPPGT
jgi:hypothetical protein